MPAKIPTNYLSSYYRKHGELPKQYKHLESSFRNGTAGAAAGASNAEILATMTPEQRRIAEEAIASRPAAGAGNSSANYGGDYMAMLEGYREKRRCGIIEAAAAVLKTPEGRAAREAYLKRHNPGRFE